MPTHIFDKGTVVTIVGGISLASRENHGKLGVIDSWHEGNRTYAIIVDTEYVGTRYIYVYRDEVARVMGPPLTIPTKELTNKQTMTQSIKSIYKALKRGEPEKTFVKTGIMNDNEELTTEGKEMFLDFLFKKNAEEFKNEVADEILKEIEKEEK